MNGVPSIGILAYGSLGSDPGVELGPLVVGKIEGVETPFPVEFARRSRTRGGAPTLVSVSEGGAPVNASVLVLQTSISEIEAKSMLWRRETRREGSGEKYDPASGFGGLRVCRLEDFAGLDVVLYADTGANIPNPTPRKLAELAIRSAEDEAGRLGRDGISYLIHAKENGTMTPLTPQYEREILRLTQTETLQRAREKLTGRRKPSREP